MRRWWKIPFWKRSTRLYPMLDEVAGRTGSAGLSVDRKKPRPRQGFFNEVDFGSYFQEYLDPGYRTQQEYEENEKPSFENFLSQPTTLSDHLAWQLGALTLEPDLATAAEFVVGNLDEDGYLAASEDELASAYEHLQREPAADQRPFPAELNGAQPKGAAQILCGGESTWCSTWIRPA